MITQWRPLHDPPVRRDQLCAVCKQPKPVIEDPKKIYRVDLDPFCSTRCCKEYHNCGTDSEHDMSRRGGDKNEILHKDRAKSRS